MHSRGNLARHASSCISFASWMLLAAAVLPHPAAVASADDPGVEFFEKSIRPLLAEHCYQCHGPDEQESGLRLDSYEAIMEGGASGAELIGSDPEQSLLIAAVEYDDDSLQMPPDGRLTEGQIANLRRWVTLGAPHPDADGRRPRKARSSVDIEAGREFWSFRPAVQPQLPKVRNSAWIRSPLDAFVLARLDAQGLAPVEPADRHTLIRRATIDLLGLPPSPEEVDAFVNDPAPDAFAKVVDRLLASPRYGERWGRHWLDVARYADSNGLDENIAHGNAWRYRDYVVESFNNDLPFDRFIAEQLAGDLLPAPASIGADVASADATRRRRLIATGFLALGPKVLAEVDEQKMEMDIVDEQVSTLGRAVLGLTLGCARCHDHKFDPISTADYYALAGIFKSTRTMESFTKIARWHENVVATPEQLAAKDAHDQQIAQQKVAIEQLVDRANEALAAQLGAGAALPKEPEKHYPEATKKELASLRASLAELEKSAPVLPTAMGVQDGDVADAAVHVRGSHLTLGTTVQRGAPAVLARGEAWRPAEEASGRLELARWLTASDHPLTSRVIVNRVWRWHFGRGLVASTDNFGRLGDRPTHPELLDWLATSFVDSGWSIKDLHRTIMLSNTYQLASRHELDRASSDPENQWYWRANVRRMEAEAIRDSLLSISGRLDEAMGGSMLHVANREFLFNHTSKDETKYESRRRSIYLPVVRNHLYDVFQLFDYADASVPNGNRPTSTVATQALFMLNSDLVIDAADGLAARVSTVADPNERVEQLYLLTFGRPPRASEARQALAFVAGIEDSGTSGELELAAWSGLCQALLASNEFVCIP